MASGKDEHCSLGKPEIWAGMFITNKLNPDVMPRCRRVLCQTGFLCKQCEDKLLQE